MEPQHDKAIFLKESGGAMDNKNIVKEDLVYLIRLSHRGVEYELVRDRMDGRLAHVFLLTPKPEGMDEEEAALEKPLLKKEKVRRTNLSFALRGPIMEPIDRDALRKYFEEALSYKEEEREKVDKEKGMLVVARTLSNFLMSERPVVKRVDLENALMYMANSEEPILSEAEARLYSSHKRNVYLKGSRIIKNITLLDAIKSVMPSKYVACISPKQILLYRSTNKLKDFIRDGIGSKRENGIVLEYYYRNNK